MIECNFRSKMFNKKCLKSFPYGDCNYENWTWKDCIRLKGQTIIIGNKEIGVKEESK